MAKLDPVKIGYIIERMKDGGESERVGVEMKVTGRRVRQLYAEYRATGEVPELGLSGRPRKPATPEMRARVEEEFGRHRCGAARLERVIDAAWGIHMPHNAIRAILREAGLASESTKGQRRRKWVRY